MCLQLKLTIIAGAAGVAVQVVTLAGGLAGALVSSCSAVPCSGAIWAAGGATWASSAADLGQVRDRDHLDVITSVAAVTLAGCRENKRQDVREWGGGGRVIMGTDLERWDAMTSVFRK